MSLFRIAKPGSGEIARFVASQAPLAFSYEPVGMTRAEDAPAGWTEDTYRTVLGPGREVFDRAKTLIRSWTMFAMPWIELHAPDAPIAVGSTVGILARSAGLWCMNAARIVYVIDEKDRFGFAYGTLPGHVESGEELFLVEHTPEDLVAYSIRALSRPRAPLARIAYPWVRREQRRFGAESLVAMRRAILN
ncbi:MAG: DUF1990 domain-containing protein [Planctomycetota bacterium]|nr:DUF1990 domain-containing protein [Planctomycetota bacterium]